MIMKAIELIVQLLENLRAGSGEVLPLIINYIQVVIRIFVNIFTYAKSSD